MRNVLVVFGTRPEAIKLAPVIRAFRKRRSEFKVLVCVTAQHREMLDQVLRVFEIIPDHDLDIMTENQDLYDLTGRMLQRLRGILQRGKPDLILVQGDTTTTFVASLAAFYMKIPVGHIEAGLRTHNKYQPFPEEMNRHLTTVIADFHFAPTDKARQCLLSENIPPGRIWVTGNTGIDALLTVVRSQKSEVRQKALSKYFEEEWNLTLSTDTDADNRKLILVTGHRRESFGEGVRNICCAIKEIARRNGDIDIVYPVHLNPNVRAPVYEILGNRQARPSKNGNIYLLEPLEYEPFVYLMNKAYVILTDSGGIQEEAPSLGKPVLVLRNTTERAEGIDRGNARLVGTNPETIITETQRLIDDASSYRDMAMPANPYGDGRAAERIVQIIAETL